MNKRERMLAAMRGEPVDRVPASFWYHFGGEQAVGEACVQAHLGHYRNTGIDFLKIMSDGINYPLRVTIHCAADWAKLEPLPGDDAFFEDSVWRCRRINEELRGECCTFYNVFSPFNVVRERDVFTEQALKGRSWDETVMAHLREDEAALTHALNVIGRDMARLAELVIRDGGCDGIYQSVQGAELGRMSRDDYARVITPSELPILEAANALSDFNMLHMCSWAGNRNELADWKDYPTRVKNWGVGIEGLGLREGARFFPGSVIMGGMDNRKTHPLYTGGKQEIQAAVRACLDEMSGLPYILAADCTVPADIDMRHIAWVMEALQN